MTTRGPLQAISHKMTTRLPLPPGITLLSNTRSRSPRVTLTMCRVFPPGTALSKRCPGTHVHEHLGSGRCAEAALYPLGLIRAILKGIRNTALAEGSKQNNSRDEAMSVKAKRFSSDIVGAAMGSNGRPSKAPRHGRLRLRLCSPWANPNGVGTTVIACAAENGGRDAPSRFGENRVCDHEWHKG